MYVQFRPRGLSSIRLYDPSQIALVFPRLSPDMLPNKRDISIALLTEAILWKNKDVSSLLRTHLFYQFMLYFKNPYTFNIVLLSFLAAKISAPNIKS